MATLLAHIKGTAQPKVTMHELSSMFILWLLDLRTGQETRDDIEAFWPGVTLDGDDVQTLLQMEAHYDGLGTAAKGNYLISMPPALLEWDFGIISTAKFKSILGITTG